MPSELATDFAALSAGCGALSFLASKCMSEMLLQLSTGMQRHVTHLILESSD